VVSLVVVVVDGVVDVVVVKGLQSQIGQTILLWVSW